MPYQPHIPPAPRAIQKGVSLSTLLDVEAIDCLAQNVRFAYRAFDLNGFRDVALRGLEPHKIMERGRHIACALREFLPTSYAEGLEILIGSMADELSSDEEFGMGPFFYLPYGFYIADYGLDPQFNDGRDPFEDSMNGLHELTRRFTAEFAIRPFLINQQERTLAQIHQWTTDTNSHVRRLCSEGSRPKLPWGTRLVSFIRDPTPVIHILEKLKDDSSLYVRRSVANHLGDIAKDHPDQVFDICQSWLHQPVSEERKWVVRHALRHPAKKGIKRALQLREMAGARTKSH